MGAFLEMRGIHKRFGGIPALDDVSLNVASGAVTALCGANGAGKSTLVRLLAGVETADAGSIRVDGREAGIRSPRDAHRLGLRFIHQELNLVPRFSAVQNMALGHDAAAARSGWLDRRAARTRARAVMDRLGAGFPLDVEVERLTVSERWMVSVGRALMTEGRLVAMDEPTASFTAEEAERVFAVVRDLQASGVAVLYISHRLDEVLRVASDVTVLRDGRLVGSYATADIDRPRLTRAIVGRDVERLTPVAAGDRRAGDTVLALDGLAREPRVRGVSLRVRRGEVLGLAGLVGAGRTELARLIAGADGSTGGTMTLEGRPYGPRTPADAIRAGVALVPEERRSQGLLLRESVAFNLNLATAGRNRMRRLPVLSRSSARAAAVETARRLGIRAASIDQPAGELSGGNQQKVVIGRCLRAAPKLLILDEPTVGVDVGARRELYDLVRGLAASGTAVIVSSSDFDELAICDRVGVMREGRLTGVVDGVHATKERLTSLCYASGEEGPA